MKLIKKAGATSEIWQVFIADSSSTTGAGLTGLTNASSGLTAYYHRDTDTTATAISLVSMTVGTFTSSGFKEIDATNMPGWYQFCPPNAALASGAKSCGFLLKGATNMAPLPIEAQLTAVDPDSATAFMTGVNSLNPPTNWNLLSIDGSGRTDVGKILGTASQGAAGYVGLDWGQITNKTTTNALTGTTISSSQTIATVTTATNLTNAPTSGDLTATMKTSVENAVWNATLSSHLTSGSTGAALNAAGSAGDPWATAIPGAYGAGTAGNIVGNTLDATISSRMATFTLPANFSSLSIDASGRMDLGKWIGTAPLALSSQQVQAVVPSSTVVASVTGAVGSVTGAVGSVTGNVGGNVVGSVASVTAGVSLGSGAITSTSIAASGGQSIADYLLDRDMSVGTDSGSPSIRTPRQAFRALRNKNSAVTGTVYKEDDSTASWTYAVTTDATADPITIIDPA